MKPAPWRCSNRTVAQLAAIVALLTTMVACARILGIRPPQRQPFPHRAHVLEDIDCEDCHDDIAEATSTSAVQLPDTETCLECHEEPHDERACRSCHGLAYVRERATMARRYLRFAHRTHIERADDSCVRCHSDIERDGKSARPGMASCFGCHPHRDQFEIRNCNDCHVNLRAEHTRPRSHVAHDGDFIREHGVRAAAARDLCASCHSETYCASCHGKSVPALASTLAFDDPLRAGFHRAGFRARHSEEARGQPGLCSTCHGADYCQSCHDAEGIGAPRATSGSVHEAGWVGLRGTPNRHGPAARTNPTECAGCHSGAGEALCIGCHRVGGNGGNPHPAGWSSRLSKTNDLPCRLCHSFGF